MKRYIITPDQHLKIKNREFLVQAFTIGRNEYQCYSKLMQYIISDSPELMNRESGLIEPVEPVERGEILDIYASAYNEGRGQFNNRYLVDSNTLYGKNADALIRQLDNKLNDKNTGWIDESQSININLNDESIRKMGFASGARNALTDLYHQHREIFEKFAIKDESQPAAAIEQSISEQPTADIDNVLICDKKQLQKLHADFDGKIWETMELENFLNCMRIEPTEHLEPSKKGNNSDFAKWISEHIEPHRVMITNGQNKAKKINMNHWFKKLVDKNLNYSTLKKTDR
jgi:hypothetical protein